jgi:putative tricarboxylic transport membrane protein
MSTGSPVKGGRPDGAAFVIALGLACLGGVLIWDSTLIPDMGGYAGVGADGMPRIVGWGLVLLALWTAIDGLRSTGETRDKIELAPVLWIIGGLVLQISLLKPLGFAIASGLLFACTAFAFGKRNFALTLPIGLAFALFVYGIFDRVLQLNLPAGPLETLLFGG